MPVDPAQAAPRLSGRRRGRPPLAACGQPGLGDPRDHGRALPRLDAASSSSSPACARAAPGHVAPAPLLAPVPDLCGLPRRRRRWRSSCSCPGGRRRSGRSPTPRRSSASTTGSSRSTSWPAARSSCSAACTWSSKNLPWAAEWLASAGYAGHLVRDLSNTHLMIVGGGTLIATGLCWYVLPRIVGRPLASEGLAQGAFWFTAGGLHGLLRRFVANGIAIGLRVRDGWEYQAAKASMGDWYRAPVGMGAGVMGIGYWCFAATVFLTVFQGRLVRVPKPNGHLWKFLATGAAGADRRHRAGRDPGPAGERGLAVPRRPRGRVDRPDRARAHQPRDRADDARRGRALLLRSAARRESAVAARGQRLLLRSSSRARSPSTASAMYLGFHEGSLVVGRGLSPEQAEEATAIHPFLLMGAGIAMLAASGCCSGSSRARFVDARERRRGASCSRAARRSPSGRSRGRSRRSRPCTTCSTAAAMPAR